MIFKKGVKGNLITLRERISRYLLAIKNANKTAKGTALTLISTVKGYKSYINSITFDQGSEFQRYDWIRGCLETEIYFCEPGAPEQKGAVENVNGVIRVELPRILDIYPLYFKMRDSQTHRLLVQSHRRRCVKHAVNTSL